MYSRRSIAHTFLAAADRAASQDAVRHGATVWTYAELAAAAGGVAHLLREAGVGQGDVVATLLARSPWTAAAALGTLAVGAAYVHIEPADPDTRVAQILGLSGPSAVLTDRANRARLNRPTPVFTLDQENPSAPFVPSDRLTAADPAYLVLTSGSTGTPKAVEVEHGSMLDYCAAFSAEIAPAAPGSYGITTTFAADLGKTCVYGALLSGARLDIYDRALTLDTAAFAAELSEHPVDCLKFTPSHLAILAREAELSEFLPVRMLLLAGEPLPPRLAAAVLKARPDLSVYNSYGPAETTVAVLMHRVTAADGERERVPVGHALSGVAVRLADSDGAPVADGTPGELRISGSCLSRGYRGDGTLTAVKFETRDGERWYRTDDLMVRGADGALEFLGRADRQLKIRGNRVEPAEVEAALLALPGVRQAVAVGARADDDAPMELVAYVVAATRAGDLAGLLHAALPSALVPSRIHLVPTIPVGVNGKVDLAALQALVDAETPAAAPADLPRTDLERRIADIWSAVLGRDGIGRHERFFEIGGDSFKILTVFGRLRRGFPGLAIATLFDHPTIAQLAAALDTDVQAAATPDVAVVEL